jgi:hypothetical protein
MAVDFKQARAAVSPSKCAAECTGSPETFDKASRNGCVKAIFELG